MCTNNLKEEENEKILTTASASTVRNPVNGHIASWTHGHDWRVIVTYSETASSFYAHSASVDSTESVLKRAGVTAHAEIIGGSCYYWYVR